MAQQKAQGTITIIDTNDIERIYTVYAKSANNATVPSTAAANWSESVSTAPGTGSYIWQRTVVEKSGTGEKTYSDPVCLTGAEGTDATEISGIEVRYGISADWNTQPSSWSADTPAYDSSKPKYWTRTRLIYDTNPVTYSDPVYTKDEALTKAVADAAIANSIAQHANEDAQGAMSQANNGIKEIYKVWYRTNTSTAPNKPSAHVTITSNDVNNTWTKVKPIENEDNRYYFYCDETVTNGGVSSWTDPVLDTSNLSQYEIGALTAKVKNYWWDSDGAHIASGINGGNVDKNSSVSAYGFNSLVGLTGIHFGYNDAKVIDLNTTPSPTSLKFYQPPTISGSTVTQGALSMELSSSALKFYGSSTSTPDATLNSNGLKLIKGGIEAGSYSSSTTNFIYLSSNDYSGSTITINGNSSGWRQIIGNKFGVKNDGTLYANNAVISGDLTASSLKINGTNYLSDITTISNKANTTDSNWAVNIVTTGTPDYVTPSVTLKATVYHEGGVVTTGFTRAWYKNGIGSSLGSGETITVTDVDAFYTCVISSSN